jgi:hypothetical protein
MHMNAASFRKFHSSTACIKLLPKNIKRHKSDNTLMVSAIMYPRMFNFTCKLNSASGLLFLFIKPVNVSSCRHTEALKLW